MATYTVNRERVQKLALAYVIDHYLQALTLKSVWPQAVGIFTAMESLKATFFNENENEENEAYNYWVVPPQKFESNKSMLRDVIETLANHFSRFGDLTQNEMQSLKAQIKNNLNRRSYKTQLKRMLDLLNVSYSPKELQFFIDTRNRLIHEGTPVPANTPLDKYDKYVEVNWQRVKNATELFERALLGFMNYDGEHNLFGASFIK